MYLRNNIMFKFMFKNVLRLLAASASFVALLLIANPAIVSSTDNSISQVESPTFNLNVISPSLELIGSSKTLSNHIGCSCTTCVQSIKSI